MPILSAVEPLRHAFTLRGADPARVLTQALGLPAPIRSLRQVHGARVQRVGPEPFPEGLEGDALITNVAGVPLAIAVADCVPVLICDPATRAIAAVHAGWRGTVAGVLGAAIRALHAAYGSDPAGMRLAMGPAIGPCCFEVGDEVVDALLRSDTGATGCVRDGDRPHIDLRSALARQARAAGVPETGIEASDLCTACRGDLLESYRRGRGRAGRMLGLIAWRS
jgi:purine-nucleoside/S-methyl-5'-thioadenosine phosphorylase / adenosine deaminase